MKKIFLKNTIQVSLFFLCHQAVMAQSINLPKEGKFKFGDNPEWATPAFNDNDWVSQQLGKSFTKDSSYAWYRIKIVIPSAMKTGEGKGIKLYLGKIDDVDQTYFNGKLIGETGSFPPDYITQWEKQRMYIIPENEVQWDKENVIAVRIYNLIGGMGMWEGPYSFEPFGWVDEVSVRQDFIENPNNGFTTRIVFTNKIDNAFSGTVKYWISNKANNKVLFSETKPVQLQAKAGAESVIIFRNFQSDKENVFHVGYQINDNNNPLFVKKEQLYIATNNLEIPFTGEVRPLIKNRVPDNFIAVSFQNQQLKGYLGTRLKQNLEQRLLKVDESGLMGSYLNRPGIHPWAGEHVGKYLEAACNVWKLTHNPALKKQMDRMMYELINTQLEDGYLGTYTPDQYWTSWDVWSHKYNLYGLLAYYTTTGYQPALDACRKMGDLLCATFGKKAGQLDIILAGTHVGMAATSVLDPMVELYKYTGDKKYLDLCYYILEAWEQDNGPKIISSLLATGKVTKVGNGKAYEMLSNFVGLVNLYRVTGDEKLLTPVLIAWQDIVTSRLYITGTTSSHEYFQEDGYLPAGNNANMGEGCVTTTWIQLNQQLLEVTGELKYIEQIERSVYNHLLGAENPQTGCVSYYTPLMGKKPFTCHITCCQSSVPRGIAMIPYFTFGSSKGIPALMMYEPAFYKESIKTDGKKNIDLSLQVESNFPENGDAVIKINISQAASFPIALRVPSWCSSFTASVGGKVYKGTANQNLIISRVWRSGERIKVSFQMPVQVLTGGNSYPGQIAFQRGPQVLALDSSLNDEVPGNYQLGPDQRLLVEKPIESSSAVLLPKTWIGKQAFTVSIIDKTRSLIKQQLVLVPFADASQTEGIMKVWLPLEVKK
ncbi:MAG: glycoside hydrolase family 127 protein [Chitinophagaceae bacterium]|nr:glycoside hydrolase family 127 protein [Chitinophagaceae bacterium]